MGASAVLLFALPASPLAQPWNMLLGNAVSACVGVACAALLGHAGRAWRRRRPWPARWWPCSRCAACTRRAAPSRSRRLQGAGPGFVLVPVGLESLLLLAVAVVYNNATRHPYPHRPPAPAADHGTRDLPPRERLGFTREDLDAVLRQQDQVLDVDPDDLAELLHQTEQRAFRRLQGEVRCADIMSRDVVTLDFGTPLQEAWDTLRQHRIHALPVLDRGRRVVGIVTLTDFLHHAGLDGPVSWASASARCCAPAAQPQPAPGGGRSDHDPPGAHGPADLHVGELVPLLSDRNFHHLPIVDERQRLVGMVTQSDLVAALYHMRATATPELSRAGRPAAGSSPRPSRGPGHPPAGPGRDRCGPARPCRASSAACWARPGRRRCGRLASRRLTSAAGTWPSTT
jgi:CBS domain-containing membrane protein